MANYNNPNGLSPLTPGARVTVYTAGASALTKGDVVGLNPSTKLVEFHNPKTHGAPLGVMAHSCSASGDAHVYDDNPATEYVAQFEGSFDEQDSLGAYDLKGTTGVHEIDGASQLYGTVQVVGWAPRAGSEEEGSNARVRCRLQPYTPLTGVATQERRALHRNGCTVETLAAARTVLLSDGDLIKFDPGGASRVVTFSATCEYNGYRCRIANAADAAEDLTVKDSAATTIAVLNQNQGADFHYAGSAWKFVGFTHIVDMSS